MFFLKKKRKERERERERERTNPKTHHLGCMFIQKNLEVRTWESSIRHRISNYIEVKL